MVKSGPELVTHVWFSPLGARNQDAALNAMMKARPMNKLHLDCDKHSIVSDEMSDLPVRHGV